jgi:hypothetical protein
MLRLHRSERYSELFVAEELDLKFRLVIHDLALVKDCRFSSLLAATAAVIMVAFLECLEERSLMP